MINIEELVELKLLVMKLLTKPGCPIVVIAPIMSPLYYIDYILLSLENETLMLHLKAVGCSTPLMRLTSIGRHFRLCMGLLCLITSPL